MRIPAICVVPPPRRHQQQIEHATVHLLNGGQFLQLRVKGKRVTEFRLTEQQQRAVREKV